MLDETALDLFARRPTHSFSTGLPFLDVATSRQDGKVSGYRPRQVVELCGPSDAPKTEVLLHVAAAFLTRSAGDPQPKERIFLFDHECEVAPSRLRAILRRRLAQEEEVQQAMGRVEMFRCRDSFQWLATLNHIHFQLLEAASAPLLLVINCVGSFHAIDKLKAWEMDWHCQSKYLSSSRNLYDIIHRLSSPRKKRPKARGLRGSIQSICRRRGVDRFPKGYYCGDDRRRDNRLKALGRNIMTGTCDSKLDAILVVKVEFMRVRLLAKTLYRGNISRVLESFPPLSRSCISVR